MDATKGPSFDFDATHVSAHDGSPAMFVSSDDTRGTITLVNEDGFEWTDPKDDWCLIRPTRGRDA